MKYSVASLLALSGAATAWLPADRNFFGEQPNSVVRSISTGKGRSIKHFGPGFNKIRGVNLGSHFIIEPWMAGPEWSSMGCGDAKSEFDCVIALGQDAANTAFQKHWDTWITEEDLDKMKEYGLNTIRVPVGYWIVENTIYQDSEHFPQGGMAYLDRLAGWAAARDLYVILDLHGAPGAQEAHQPFTGQLAPTAGFYETYQYERAYNFLQNVTERIHKNDAYRTTGMLEVLNEPQSGHPTLVSEYYANAYTKIREVESNLNIPAERQLTIQYMDKAWNAGNPKDAVGGKPGVAYDNHRYLKYAGIEKIKSAYISTSCSDTFGEADNRPVVIGEWSIAVDSSVESSPDWSPSNPENKAFYTQWWAAQVQAYEKELGWTFWAWKSQLGNDYRWSYRQAVEAFVIPKDPNEAAGLARC